MIPPSKSALSEKGLYTLNGINYWAGLFKARLS